MKVKDIFENANHVFSKPELLQIFAPFLDRLELDHGNDREEMIRYHIDRLVGKTTPEVLRLMPRGPRGHWADLMSDIRDTIINYPEYNEQEEDEAWDVKHTGENTNKSIADLEHEKAAAKRSHNVKRERQKNFAIMAKRHWK